MVLLFPEQIVYESGMQRKAPTQKKSVPEYIKKLTHDSVPASVGLVKAVRNEMDARFDIVDARFDAVDARFDAVDARFDAVDARFDSVESKMSEMDLRLNARIDGLDKSLNARIDGLDAKFTSKFNEVLVSVHRTQVLMEEQRSENRIVLDGIKNVIERMDRVEEDQRELRKSFIPPPATV